MAPGSPDVAGANGSDPSAATNTTIATALPTGRAIVSGLVRRACGWIAALRPRTVGLLSGLAIGILGAALCAVFLLHDRAAELEQARRDLRAISLPAADALERGLGTLDLMVSLAVEGFGRGEWDLAGVYAFLHSQAKRLDQLDALDQLAIIDAKGIVRYTAKQDRIGADVSDRNYFRRHLEPSGAQMIVEAPIISRFPPRKRVVPVSWALRTHTGELAGVVVVVADWRLFAGAFAKLISRPEQTVALIDHVGRLYALDMAHWPDQGVEPQRPAFLGTLSSAGRPQREPDHSAEHLAARAELPNFGLQVVTGVPIATILLPWWLRVWLASGLLLVTVVGAGWLSAQLHYKVATLRATVVAARSDQARAEAGERSKGQFLAAMSHEIRTPMTGVLGMADLLDATPLAPQQRSYVAAIQTSGSHLLSVINDILDYSRIDAGGLVLEQVDFALAPLLAQVRSIVAPQAAERGIRLEMEPMDGVPATLRGDPTRLRQILLNLIGNGLKFTRQGSVAVRVGGQQQPDGRVLVRFEIEDTGIGIPAERQAGLFRPFMQVDLSTTRQYGGTGLGLAISRELVSLMGGRIGVTSAPGRGSLFWFEVPLPVGDVAAAKAAVTPAAAAGQLSRVLVAEDIQLNRDLLLAGLTRAGHEVVLVGDGAAAVASVAEQPFDVVLMDVHMPVLDGIEAARRIRALPGPAGKIPILALTASVMAAERDLCLSAGMNAVLAKPIVWPRLLAAIAELRPNAMPSPTTSLGAVQPDAGPPLATEPGAIGTGLPDLDHKLLGSLAQQLPPETLQRLLRQGLDGASRSCTLLREALGDPGRLRQEAHRLRGTSGSFGLARVSALAGAIEDRAARGEDVADLLPELERATAAAHASLVSATLSA